MGQCICTLCTLPASCVGSAIAPSFGTRAFAIGAFLSTVGIVAFAILSIRCGKIDFVGGDGNACWSEGASAEQEWGLLAAGGLGVGVPMMLYGRRRRQQPERVDEAATEAV